VCFVGSIRLVLAACALLLAPACGGSSQIADEGQGEYPVVTDPPPEYGETVTEPGGALSSRLVKPEEYETEPSPTCERQQYASASGEGLIVVPPRPGLGMLVSIVANDSPGATPTTVTVPFTGDTGAATLRYPDFLPPPDVALASAVMARGPRSRTAKVLIQR
jgi:hypothetical protein